MEISGCESLYQEMEDDRINIDLSFHNFLDRDQHFPSQRRIPFHDPVVAPVCPRYRNPATRAVKGATVTSPKLPTRIFNTSAATKGAFRMFSTGSPFAMKSRNIVMWLPE